MYQSVRSVLLTLVFLSLLDGASGQNIVLHDPPRRYVPEKPPTRQEMERVDALHQYVHGLVCETEDRLDDALKAFEESARLDSEAPAAFKAQVPILIAMDRLSDALKVSRQVVALDPGDYSSWYVTAKLHKTMVKYPEAIAALESGLKSDQLKKHPEAAQQLYFELGSLYENTDKYGLAADAFAKAAAILEHPDLIMDKGPFPRELIEGRAAETYEKISQLYRKAKQFDQAITALKKAQKHAPERAARISFHLAELSLEKGDHQLALNHVDAYLRTQPLGLEAYQMKIELLHKLKQTQGLVPWLEEAAQRDRHNSGLQLMLAKQYAQARQTAKAEKLYKKLAEDTPSAELYRGLFQLYKERGRVGMAEILTLVNGALDKAGNEDVATLSNQTHARAMLGAVREDGDLAKELVHIAFREIDKHKLRFNTLYFLAMLAERHHKNEEAERFYRDCLAVAKTKPMPASEYLIYRGYVNALSRLRKHELCVQVCQEGLKTATATPAAFFHEGLARAHAELRRYDEALRWADRGIAQGGEERLGFKLLRIHILTMAERYDEAETECKAMLKAHDLPSEAIRIRTMLSHVYSSAKQQVRAEEQLHIILKIDPDNARINNDLGYLWADHGKNLEIAEGMIRKAIELDRAQRRRSPNFSADSDKDNAAYVDSLGWVLFRKGQIEEARKELERAASLDDGDDPVIYDHLGDVYNRLRMRQEASRAWQRALELYDNGPRSKDEDRVKDIRRKINQVKEEVGGR